MWITLNLHEMAIAAQVGARRQIEARSKKLRDKHGFSGDDSWMVHIEGACGELCAAKAIGRAWEYPIGTFKKGGDVGRIQVRTRSNVDWDLNVRKDDRDEDIFVLVVGVAPTFNVVGWLHGGDCKRVGWWGTYDHRPECWWVKQSFLKPIEEITPAPLPEWTPTTELQEATT